MDWLFDHNNAENLLTMISRVKGKDALTKPPIKYFVNMMWSRFQPRIVSYVFFPYLIYLGLIMISSGSVVNTFMTTRNQIDYMEEFAHLQLAKDPNYSFLKNEEYLRLVKSHNANRNFFIGESIVLLILIVYFGIIQLRQYKEAGWLYFTVASNLLDMTSLCLNFSFVSMFFICVLYD